MTPSWGDRRTYDLLLPSLDPRERHRPSLVTIFGPQRRSPNLVLAQTTASTKLSMTQKFFIGVIEEHMTCWYYHWTPGGGTDPVWLRFFASETITKLGHGPNYSLDKTFNNAEILHGVIEEQVICWYHHGTQGAAQTQFGYDFWALEPTPNWVLAQTTAWSQLSMTQKSFMA